MLFGRASVDAALMGWGREPKSGTGLLPPSIFLTTPYPKHPLQLGAVAHPAPKRVQGPTLASRPPEDPQVVPAGDRGKWATLSQDNHGSLGGIAEPVGRRQGAMPS